MIRKYKLIIKEVGSDLNKTQRKNILEDDHDPFTSNS